MSVTRHRIRVKPGSRRGPTVQDSTDGVLLVTVRERPVDGAANEAALRALAAHWGVSRRDLRIVTGHTARMKTVELDSGG